MPASPRHSLQEYRIGLRNAGFHDATNQLGRGRYLLGHLPCPGGQRRRGLDKGPGESIQRQLRQAGFPCRALICAYVHVDFGKGLSLSLAWDDF